MGNGEPGVSYPDDVPSLTDGRVTLRAHRATDIDAIDRVYEYATRRRRPGG